MNSCNLYSVLCAKNCVSEPCFASYLNYFNVDTYMNGGTKGIRENELEDIEVLCANLLKQPYPDISFYDGYYLGYKIPQIGKEFDLLRFGEEYLVNIEIKRNCDRDKIRKQLIRNRYYLSFLKGPVKLYTYAAGRNTLYKLKEDDVLETVPLSELCDVLRNQTLKKLPDIDDLFDPANYLVSPFNSVERFISGEYFLTNHQETIERQIYDAIVRKEAHIFSVTGAAGTGKTLLVYDMAKNAFCEGKKFVIFHCAGINAGQKVLIQRYGWKIMPAKSIFTEQLEDCSFLIIDEAQRMKVDEFNYLMEQINRYHLQCLFSYDRNQCLEQEEISCDIPGRLDEVPGIMSFHLTNAIRTNADLDYFVHSLADCNYPVQTIRHRDIELYYVNDWNSVQHFLRYLGETGWAVPQYTPREDGYFFSYDTGDQDEKDSIHAVIGQDYEKIAAVIDHTFYYDRDGFLSNSGKKGKNNLYLQGQMLIQILTRARRKLALIIINNEQMFRRCLDILGEKHSE